MSSPLAIVGEWEDVLLTAEVQIKKYFIKNRKGGALHSVFKKLVTKKLDNLSLANKRMSSCSSGTLRASMTVEACFVLPFFLFAFLNIISVLELYRLQGNMNAAMHDTVKNMAVHGYEYRTLRGEAAGRAESLGLTCLYAANKIKNRLGTDYLDNAPIVGGASAIGWFRSSVMEEDDCIDLLADYRIRPPAAVVGFHECRMYNRLRTRAWTGYDNAGTGSGGDTQEEIVYITPEGEVYHRSRGCTHLKLSIMAVDRSFLERERNESGEIFYPCEECGAGCGNTVYITSYGNRYHATLGCSKLKRTVLAVPISQTGGRGACNKCGG